MKPTFLEYDKALLTVMVQANNPDRIVELVEKSLPCGAEAFGMQFERLKAEYRKKEIYRQLFSCTDKPIYVTNYRMWENEGKSDEQLADELLELASCGATLCDVMGDLYDKNPDELTMDPDAVEKQIRFIEKLHNMGAEVLMSSHIIKFITAERVLEMALEQQRRGADICKIVVDAKDREQEVENMRIIEFLSRNLKIPFLFLSVGECGIMRKIGGELGCCMYLCVYEHDELSAPAQPLLKHVKAVRDNL